MILVETEVNAEERRSRSLLLRHGATQLPRRLEPGEVVVVRSGTEHRTACVLGVDASGGDPVYRLALGGALRAAEARSLVATTGDVRTGGGSETRSTFAGADVVAMVAMLGSLRQVGRDAVRVPSQRGSARALAGPA